MVALRPAALSANGWMWIRPSPCEWIPSTSCVASCGAGWYSPGTSLGLAIVVDVSVVVVSTVVLVVESVDELLSDPEAVVSVVELAAVVDVVVSVVDVVEVTGGGTVSTTQV